MILRLGVFSWNIGKNIKSEKDLNKRNCIRNKYL